MGRSLKDWGKAIGRSRAVVVSLGVLLASYLRFVHATSRILYRSPAIDSEIAADRPVITALWHGQHFMVPLIKPKGQPFAVLMAAHADAEMNAIAIERLGLQTIRASGAQKPSEIRRKKGMVGFLQMLKALKNGTSIAMTADVPKGPAKKAGRGIVMLARHSGRPIMPLAYASSRRWNVNSWDAASFNLPFSRVAVVTSDLIHVPAETSDEEIDAYCARLTESLNEATRKAYAIVDRTE